MATTNIQTFSGDVEVTSNILMSGEVFIKANDGNGKVGIGLNAALTSQGTSATAVGALAGQYNQGIQAVAVGRDAGSNNQGDYATAVGYSAGYTSQGNYATAVGVNAGNINQGSYAIAVGLDAGKTSQGGFAVAVGRNAGATSQGVNAVAVGINAGLYNQGTYAVAVGDGAGSTSQGTKSVAVGYLAGYGTQHNNSIILNASGAALNTAQASSFYVKPIRSRTDVGGGLLVNDSTSGEVTSLVKNIVYKVVTINGPTTPVDFSQTSFTYGFTASAVAKLVITATPMNQADYGDTFTFTISNLTTTGAEINCKRVDSASAWGQVLQAAVCIVELN